MDRFPQTKPVKDGFARGLLCKMDLQIAGWGLTSLHGHWKWAEGQLREIRHRLNHDNPSVNKSCKEASKKEHNRQEAMVVGMSSLQLESRFALKVAHMLDVESELEERRRRSQSGDSATSGQKADLPVFRLVGGAVWFAWLASKCPEVGRLCYACEACRH